MSNDEFDKTFEELAEILGIQEPADTQLAVARQLGGIEVAIIPLGVYQNHTDHYTTVIEHDGRPLVVQPTDVVDGDKAFVVVLNDEDSVTAERIFQDGGAEWLVPMSAGMMSAQLLDELDLMPGTEAGWVRPMAPTEVIGNMRALLQMFASRAVAPGMVEQQLNEWANEYGPAAMVSILCQSIQEMIVMLEELNTGFAMLVDRFKDSLPPTLQEALVELGEGNHVGARPTTEIIEIQLDPKVQIAAICERAFTEAVNAGLIDHLPLG